MMITTKNKIKPAIITIFVSVMLISANSLAAADYISLNPGSISIKAGGRCEILEDKTGSLTIDVILSDKYKNSFTMSKQDSPNFGFTRSDYWVRLYLKNGTTLATNHLLEVAFPQLDTVEFYLLDKESCLVAYEASGRDYPFIKRAIDHRNSIFQVKIPPGEERICYLKIRTGDGMIFPITIWTPYSFIKKAQVENLIFGIYYGIILVMIFYNLFIYLSTRDRNYMLYVLFITVFGLFQLSMNGLAIQYIWFSNPWAGKHSVPLLIALSCLFAALFTIRFLSMKKTSPLLYRIMQVLAASGIVLAAASLTAGYHITIVAGQILPALMICTVIPASINGLIKGNKSARFYLTAWIIFLTGVLFSALRVAGLLPHNLLTEYGLQAGSGLQMVLLSLALADRINLIEGENARMQEQILKDRDEHISNLNRSKQAIEEAHALLGLSEEKYRSIVESSSDVIFTLDRDMNFINANTAIAKEFKLDPRHIAGLSFYDLLYTHEVEQSMFGILVKEKLNEFMRDRKPIHFRALLASSINMGPKEMQVQLEYINVAGKDEILGKMSNIIDDSLLGSFISEQQKYTIGNYLIKADEITHRITRNLKKYLQQNDIRMIQVALREVIINAIEHGNLNISFDEKSHAISSGTYFSLIRERQNNPEMMNKKVTIEYTVNDELITYIISDEGDGFKFEEFLNSTMQNINSDRIPHGRGLHMVNNIFDRITFNDRGNIVTLVKYLKREDK